MHFLEICKIRKCFSSNTIDRSTALCYTEDVMEFSNLRVKELKNVLKHTPSVDRWQAKARMTHIVGIQLCGKMYHEMNGKSLPLADGDVFFFNAKDDFQAVVKERGMSYTVHFTAYEPIETESFAVHAADPRKFTALLDDIARAVTPQDAGGNLALSLFYRLCHLIDHQAKQSYHPSDRRIVAAEEYLRLHFKEKDALALATESTALTARRFCDLFRAQYGIPPGKYLTALRIAAAKEALASPMSVKQAAEAAGFLDLYYFSKLFKKETGMSPTDFRKNNV